MSYLQRINVGVYAKAVGLRWLRGGGSATVPAHLWVFTDCLVLTPTYMFDRNRPMRVLQDLDLEQLEPDAISAAYPKAMCLDRDRVVRVVYDGPSGTGFFYAHFDLAGAPRLNLWVDHSLGEPVLALLRETYPGLVEDHRADRR
jgi:hypothetical protein